MVNAKWRGMVVANVNGSLWQSGTHGCEERRGEINTGEEREGNESLVVIRGEILTERRG